MTRRADVNVQQQEQYFRFQSRLKEKEVIRGRQPCIERDQAIAILAELGGVIPDPLRIFCKYLMRNEYTVVSKGSYLRTFVAAIVLKGLQGLNRSPGYDISLISQLERPLVLQFDTDDVPACGVCSAA